VDRDRAPPRAPRRSDPDEDGRPRPSQHGRGGVRDGQPALLRRDIQTLATKALLDGVASIALAASLGWGVGLSAISILLYQGSITLGAGLFEDVLQGEALAAMTSAGGITIIAISLKLLQVRDVGVGNFLPALVVAPLLVAVF
jgi:uncharacterized protein